MVEFYHRQNDSVRQEGLHQTSIQKSRNNLVELYQRLGCIGVGNPRLCH